MKSTLGFRGWAACKVAVAIKQNNAIGTATMTRQRATKEKRMRQLKTLTATEATAEPHAGVGA